MQIGVEISKAIENKRVFIVVEDEIIRAALQFMLHDEYEAHEVDSFARAFQKAREWKPDLVLLSDGLLRADGMDMIEVLKSKAPDAKVMVVVEAGDADFGKACQAAGADSFIAKPLKIEFVRQKVDQLLGRRASVTIPLTVLTR